MKQFLLACILMCCMNSCSFGQDRTFFSGNVFSDPAIRKVDIALASILRFYVDTVNSDKVAEDAITGMLEKLDPHSAYLTAEEVKESNEPLQGNFDGIGIQFNMLTDTLYVIQVIADGPSEKVGIQAGDRIIFVDDTLIAGVKMKNTDIMSKLRGPKGTIVNVKVLRNGNPGLLDFKIVRDKIPVYSVSAYYMIDKKTGYIKIIRFAKTTSEEFREALGKLQAQGMENLIMDLQDNTGGYLETAVELSNEFLNPNSLIVYMEGVHQRRKDYQSVDGGSFRKGKLVVLINESSASASEITSGAIQDWDRGVIVGRRTFGKGLVQTPIPLPDGSMIRLTTARYYTPTGRSIQKPYVKGDLESYNKEVIDRYNRGEMISADSIHFPDSLKYNTLIKKRVVYGGGGIMPDYYIPMDTTDAFFVARTTPLFQELYYYRGAINKYVQTLLETNRKQLKEQYPSFDSFKKNFTVSDNMLNDLLEMYKKDKTEEQKTNTIQLDANNKEIKQQTTYQLTVDQEKDLVKSKDLILHFIKMNIAREVYGDNEFYQLFNSLFDTYNKAIEIISNDKAYNKLLNPDKK